MMRYVILIALLMCLPVRGEAWQVLGGGVVSDPSILFYWGCESETIEKSGGDTTATKYSDADLSTATHPVGAKSLRIPGAYDYYAVDWSSASLNLDSGRIGFYIVLEDALWVNVKLFDLTFDSRNSLSIYGYTGGKVRAVYKSADIGGAVLGSTVTEAGTYFVELAYDRGSDYLEIFVNGASVGTGSADLGPGWEENPSILSIGNNSAVSYAYNIDQIIVSSDKTKDLYALRASTSF